MKVKAAPVQLPDAIPPIVDIHLVTKRVLGDTMCVFRKSVTGRFGIVTTDFGNVTGDSGIVTEEISIQT